VVGADARELGKVGDVDRELDMTGPGVWRRALVAVGVIGAVALLAGCSHGPDPKAQRQEMVAATQAVMQGVMFNAKTPEATVLDDASKPIDCPSGGTQFRYIAYRTTDSYAGMPDVNLRFYLLKTMVLGAGAEGFHHTRFVEVVAEGAGECRGRRSSSWTGEPGRVPVSRWT